MNETKLLTVAETARILKVSRSTVYRLVQRGILRAIRPGKGLRILAKDVERLLLPIREEA